MNFYWRRATLLYMSNIRHYASAAGVALGYLASIAFFGIALWLAFT